MRNLGLFVQKPPKETCYLACTASPAAPSMIIISSRPDPLVPHRLIEELFAGVGLPILIRKQFLRLCSSSFDTESTCSLDADSFLLSRTSNADPTARGCLREEFNFASRVNRQ